MTFSDLDETPTPRRHADHERKRKRVDAPGRDRVTCCVDSSELATRSERRPPSAAFHATLEGAAKKG